LGLNAGRIWKVQNLKHRAEEVEIGTDVLHLFTS
jgi:hypothetical protein